MNYAQIIDLALSYADRSNTEITGNMDNFLKMVEARVNREIRVREMTIRATLVMNENDEYYPFPADFGGLRDIQLAPTGGGKKLTGKYRNPEQMNNLSNATVGELQRFYYTIVANQVQVQPLKDDTFFMEILYYRKLIPLDSTNDENWLSDDNPDAYIFGLLIEINSFTKDADALSIWNDRFTGVLDSIEKADNRDRWSGTPLEVQVG